MIIDLTKSASIGLMASIAQLTGTQIQNGVLVLPEIMGKGYIKSFNLGPKLHLMIHKFELEEDIILKRNPVATGRDLITFSFRKVFHQNNEIKNRQAGFLPSVQVTSADMDFEIFTPAKTQINTILISVHTDLLKDLLNQQEGSTLLQTIVSGNQPYLYEEIISPEIQTIAAKIVEADANAQLSDFYYRIKAEELIYMLFVELSKRGNVHNYPLNITDVKMVYSIKDKIISDLNISPNLYELAFSAGMSESKMQRLFKQIFGNSVHSYYQMLRINEAAYLIKEQKVSVSEAGYRTGFTNLSHFTRIFERQMGLKPKKYSIS
ncbi:helix-turn-helix transcriptional regulator [Dyadobacter frigoris]|uniref:Helix-turn-helix transcriptional regulator n=1 Tax=Dyadobacter frigoris TaxID=2576211 RepID=A0A4U6D8W3_9BACT|nr:AraC family transcriptional regulator [Dyadobacter frigoris]TKT92801.1 helix-turn-helix transcriptional regulator [Dyadobacter frigoris]GLU54490.1 AraC family transcriptional regulator [Dyadobacter frigoris]